MFLVLVASDIQIRTDLSDKPLSELRISSFFGSGVKGGSGVNFIDDHIEIFNDHLEGFPYSWMKLK